jgi:hypothetical protein
MKPKTLTACLHPLSISVSLLVMIALCLVLYIYFVAASVLSVVMRQDAERGVVAVRSEIAALETKLIAAQHEISSRLATLDGYERDNEKVFVVRGGGEVALRDASGDN